jgi:hypothetical protein
MANWKYTDEKRNVVVRTNDDGSMESCFVTREDIQEWVAAGGVIEEPDGAAAGSGEG